MKKHYNTLHSPTQTCSHVTLRLKQPLFFATICTPQTQNCTCLSNLLTCFFLNWATENVNQQRYNCDQLYQFSLNYMCYNWVGMCCHHSCELIEGWSLSWRCWLWGQWRDEIQGFVTREGSERGCHWWT